MGGGGMVGVTVATLPRGRCHQQAMSDTQVRMMKMMMTRRRVIMMMMRWRRSHVGKAMSVTKVIPVIMFVVMAITG